MFNARRMVVLACQLFVGACVLLCVVTITKSSDREIKTMNQNQFLAKDKQGTAVVFEWFKTSMFSPALAAVLKDAWTFARDAYTPVEMQFLQEFPDLVGKEAYFKPFELLFKDGVAKVDWAAATTVMQSILQGHFIFDPTKFPENVIKAYENDSCFFVTVKDATSGKALGFIAFLMRANYPAGVVKVMYLAVNTAHQNRGLGKLLMSSLFKIVPDVKRIFLCTRVTNETALRAYRSWGFVNDENPIFDHAFNLEHWMFMEYKAEKQVILQQVASEISAK